MNQKSFWLGVLTIIATTFVLSRLVNKIAPSDGYFVGALMFLLLYGWIIRNLYTHVLAHNISFEKYRNGHAIAIAVSGLIVLSDFQPEFINTSSLILVHFILYSNGVLSLFGKSSNLLGIIN